MKAHDFQERQFVRVRPSLGGGFDFGPVVDTLPGNRLRIRWVLDLRRGAIVDEQDVIPCGDLGEEILLRDIDNQIRTMARLYPREWGATLNALGISVEYWLDLRRDGCNAQIEDFNDMFARVLKYTVKLTPVAKARS